MAAHAAGQLLTAGSHPTPVCAGSLVKALEELGIGRPGTYAPTLNLLQVHDRQPCSLCVQCWPSSPHLPSSPASTGAPPHHTAPHHTHAVLRDPRAGIGA